MKTNLRLAAFLALLLMCLFTIMRMVFYIKYNSLYQDVSFVEVLFSFAVGIRFDVASVMVIGGVFFLLLLVPLPFVKKPFYRNIILFLFAVAMMPCFFILAGDLLYYQFISRRLSLEIYSVTRNFSEISRMIAGGYTMSLVLLILFICALYVIGWKLVKGITKKEHDDSRLNDNAPFKRYMKEGLVFITAIIIVILSIRGGLQSKPLRESYAFRTDNLPLGHLSLNPIFTVARVLFKGDSESQEFLPKNEAVARVQHLLLNNETISDNNFPLMRKKNVGGQTSPRNYNVIIFIMESWGAKNIGLFGNKYHPSPNFDSLAAHGMLFTNFFASGQRTIQGVQAVTASLPTLFSEDIIGGAMEQDAFRPLGSILKENGYQTLFMYSAFRGSMGLEAFSQLTGFERFIAQEDFDKSTTKSDQMWGVFDGYAFLRANEEFKSMKEPFCGAIMSVSSHTPYDLPSKEFEVYGDTIPDYKFLNAFRYSDYALGKFFEEARKSKYFDNTIFVIVADHVEGFGEKDMYERFHIPCLIYSPQNIPAQIIEEPHSQVDILPMLLNMLNLDVPHSSFGKSSNVNNKLQIMSNPSPHSFAFLPNGTTYGWVEDSLYLIADEEKNIGLYKFRNDHSLKNNILTANSIMAADMRKNLFSYLQVGRSVLRENRLYKRK